MKIKFLPYQAHCFAFGGFEVQMLSAFDAVKARGLHVEKLDIWSRDIDFDILHCWGLDIGNYENIYWASKAKKKIVVTALSSYFETFKEQARFYVSSIIHKQRLVKKIAGMIDEVVVVNQLQAEIYEKYYKIHHSKISVIPNIVNSSFFEIADAGNKASDDYILCAGNVCQRKNQLNLAHACIESKTPLVLIGKPLDGETKYGERLKKLVENNQNLTWIMGLPENSDKLIDYFINSKAVALPSYMEQQPIALLEAAVLNKPLIIANKAYARQEYYRNSVLVEPGSVNSIKKGINEVTNNRGKYIKANESLNRCRSTEVGKAYDEVYNK